MTAVPYCDPFPILRDAGKGKVKLTLGIINYHAMKTYMGVEI
jgi:hypothetical protein